SGQRWVAARRGPAAVRRELALIVFDFIRHQYENPHERPGYYRSTPESDLFVHVDYGDFDDLLDYEELETGLRLLTGAGLITRNGNSCYLTPKGCRACSSHRGIE